MRPLMGGKRDATTTRGSAGVRKSKALLRNPLSQPPVAPSTTTTSTSPTTLTDIPEPTDNDVLSGRGVTTNKHAGNVNFRSLVALNKELYVTSTKKQKMAISRSIVEAVRSMNPPGRFLDKNPSTGLWNDIGDRKAIEKTSQALRDGAAVLRKQLSEDLGDPAFLSAVFEQKRNAAAATNSVAAVSKSTIPAASGTTSLRLGNKAVNDAASHTSANTTSSTSCSSNGNRSGSSSQKSKVVQKKGHTTIKGHHRRTKSVPHTSLEKKRALTKKSKVVASSTMASSEEAGAAAVAGTSAEPKQPVQEELYEGPATGEPLASTSIPLRDDDDDDDFVLVMSSSQHAAMEAATVTPAVRPRKSSSFDEVATLASSDVARRSTWTTMPLHASQAVMEEIPTDREFAAAAAAVAPTDKDPDDEADNKKPVGNREQAMSIDLDFLNHPELSLSNSWYNQSPRVRLNSSNGHQPSISSASYPPRYAPHAGQLTPPWAYFQHSQRTSPHSSPYMTSPYMTGDYWRTSPHRDYDPSSAPAMEMSPFFSAPGATATTATSTTPDDVDDMSLASAIGPTVEEHSHSLAMPTLATSLDGPAPEDDDVRMFPWDGHRQAHNNSPAPSLLLHPHLGDDDFFLTHATTTDADDDAGSFVATPRGPQEDDMMLDAPSKPTSSNCSCQAPPPPVPSRASPIVSTSTSSAASASKQQFLPLRGPPALPKSIRTRRTSSGSATTSATPPPHKQQHRPTPSPPMAHGVPIPTSFLEDPEVLLQMPIAPCGPRDLVGSAPL